MKVSEAAVKDFCILYVEGKVDSTQVPDFEKMILGPIERGERNMIINCRGLKYISSTGLRVFLIAQKRMLGSKGKLYLCELSRPVLETVAISGFSTIFKIFETEEEALDA
jgi:anti-anti-sigma factor